MHIMLPELYHTYLEPKCYGKVSREVLAERLDYKVGQGYIAGKNYLPCGQNYLF